MSLENIRQISSKRFADFTGLPNTAKFYPNLKEPVIPASGVWARFRIMPVMRYTAGISNKPCTRQNGSIVIELYTRLDEGTAKITKIADDLQAWFDYFQQENLWCGACETYYDGRAETNDAMGQQVLTGTVVYAVRVYVPFEYDEHN